jgi:hypothetical protein
VVDSCGAVASVSSLTMTATTCDGLMWAASTPPPQGTGGGGNPCGDGCGGCATCTSTGCVACPIGEEGICTC